MSLTMSVPDEFGKTKTNLSFVELAKENLMNEPLISMKVLKNNRIDYGVSDPNFVMDMRHKMFQQSSKTCVISKLQIHSEALKILRLENHNRLMQVKESKLIEREIAKQKQIMNGHRLLTMKEIDKITNRKIKPSSNISKFAKNHSKLPARSEYCDTVCTVNGFLNVYDYVAAETKNSQWGIPVDSKVLSKKIEPTKEVPEPVFRHNNSMIEFDIESEKPTLKVIEKNEEINKTIFEKDIEKVKEGSPKDLNEKLKIREDVEMVKTINQKILERAWRTWKAHVRRLKNRRKEKRIYTSKIESFLSYIQEKNTKQEKAKRVKREKKSNLISENLIRIKGKQKTEEEKEEKLKKLMEEVKTSQADTKKKLMEMTGKNEGKFSNHKFLEKIEKRREERLKRRKELEEKKVKLREEREKEEREKERERIQKEKQMRLEEQKRKQRLEEEKRLEQIEKREKLRLNRILAENHYETYLIRSYGWTPWATLLKFRHLQYRRAVVFYEKRIMQTIFCRWAAHVKEYIEKVTTRADDFYKNILKEKHWLVWRGFFERKKIQDQVAVDWNEFKTTEKAFKRWLEFTQDEILEYLNKKESARLFYERKLKAKFLKKLKAYPEFSKMEQAKEIRKRLWRQKIKEILPDYQPVAILE